MEKDLKYWAFEVKQSQMACNLSGVVYSFAEFMKWLRETYPNKNTNWYNDHCISVLFSQTISNITNSESCVVYNRAFDDVEQIISS
jgi:hypothetical protein